MPAQQRAVDFAHRTLAELLAERGVDGLVARNHHQSGGAEIKTMRQSAAGKPLYQPIMHRVEITRIFPRQTQQARGFIDQQQMVILVEDVDFSVARRGDKGIDNRRHQAARRGSGCG